MDKVLTKYVGDVHIAAHLSFPDEWKNAWLQGVSN